jgi:hypothetical protein
MRRGIGIAPIARSRINPTAASAATPATGIATTGR